MTAPSRLRSAALTYAAMNQKVFPLRPYDTRCDGDKRCDPICGCPKKPATRNGFHDATTAPDQINDWWRHNPDFNIGLCPWSDIAVIDEDVSGQKTGDDSVARLIGELGPLPPTWQAETATGGRHIWLCVGDDISHRGAHKSIAPFVDIKIGAKGYVCAPPSRTPVGAYRWLDPDRIGLPSIHLPAEAPEAWRERILKPLPRQHTGPPRPPAASGENPLWVTAAVTGELNKLAAAIPGDQSGQGRNDTLLAVACRLFGLSKGGHLGSRGAAEEMRRIARELGLGDNEIEDVFRSAWSRTKPEHPPTYQPVGHAYTIDPTQARQ
jgi:hypothetical protein